jgi:hypothetical protein
MHAFAQVLPNARAKSLPLANRLTDNQKSRCLEIATFVSINLQMALFGIYYSIITNIML